MNKLLMLVSLVSVCGFFSAPRAQAAPFIKDAPLIRAACHRHHHHHHHHHHHRHHHWHR